MNANTQLLYRYSDGNTYTDNLTLRQAKRFRRLQNGGVIVAMEIVKRDALYDALVELLDACPTSCEDKRLIEAQRKAEAAIKKVTP